MTDVHDTAPLDTAQLRSWARWCPGQTNLMCLNHLLHRAADEIDRLRDVEAERDQRVSVDLHRRSQERAEAAEARLAAVEAVCADPIDNGSGWTVVYAHKVIAAARGEDETFANVIGYRTPDGCFWAPGDVTIVRAAAGGEAPRV